MEYYKLLQLEQEPFSNSPDPDYFFQSRQHQSCMQKLEVALRLKRGLNVVIGDVGTGKTTLCRELIRKFAKEPEIETHLILDPAIPSADEFLSIIHSMLCNQPLQSTGLVAGRKEAIKQALFDKGVKEKKTVILMIDEGQKISPICMEIVRELLNYETNSYKLLQIAIFAQQEFVEVLEAHPNFSDRINYLHHLGPMNFSDTCRMIRHRLKLASGTPKPVQLFTLPALWVIYRASKGYPRRIIHLCHQSVLAMIIQNRTRAGWALIRSCKKRLAPVSRFALFRKTALAALGILMLCGVGVYYVYPNWYANGQRQARLFPIPGTFQSLADPDITYDSGDTEKSEEKTLPRQPLEETPTGALVSDAADADIPAVSQSDTNARLLEGTAPVLSPVNEPDLIAAVTTDKPLTEPIPVAQDATPPTPPALLGELRILYGDTLYKLISRVYGVFQPSHLAAVMEANPDIIDPNAIETCQSIWFPAIEFEPNPLLSQCAWIIIDQETTMHQAMKRLELLSFQRRWPVRMIAGWSAEEDLQFYLTVRGYFASHDKAVSFLEGLPEAMTGRACIIDNWPAKIMLFGDPYIGGIR